jgi:hypothetical protein
MTKRELITRLRRRGHLVASCERKQSGSKAWPDGFYVHFRQHPKVENFGPTCRKMTNAGLTIGTLWGARYEKIELVDAEERRIAYESEERKWKAYWTERRRRQARNKVIVLVGCFAIVVTCVVWLVARM